MAAHCLDYFDIPVAAADNLAAVARYIVAAVAAVDADAVRFGILDSAVELAVAVVDCQYAQNLTSHHESQSITLDRFDHRKI